MIHSARDERVHATSGGLDRQFLPAAMRRSGSRFPGCRLFLESFQDLAGSDDQLVRPVQHLPVNNLVDPMAALARPEAQLTLPRGCEEEAAPEKPQPLNTRRTSSPSMAASASSASMRISSSIRPIAAG